jgi:hypothetical protein
MYHYHAAIFTALDGFTLWDAEGTAHDIQGDSVGKVNIFGGYNIGNFEKKKVNMDMCLIVNIYRDRAVSKIEKLCEW